MSGLGELGGLPQFSDTQYGGQVAQVDLDQYDQVAVNYPSVDGSWIGTVSGTVSGNTALVKKNLLMDWPRNAKYALNGITNGTYGGTFISNIIDQFGQGITETVAVPAAVNGGTVYGTAIIHKYVSGSFISQGSSGTWIGTASVGAGTALGTAGNYFGLLTKIGATSDVKSIRYCDNGVVSVMGGGSLLGTNLSTSMHAFQGTGGVKVTDTFTVIVKPSYNNIGHGTMSGL